MVQIIPDDGAFVEVGDEATARKAEAGRRLPAHQKDRLSRPSGQPVRVVEVSRGNGQQGGMSRYAGEFEGPARPK